jgi:hypothetical protein
MEDFSILYGIEKISLSAKVTMIEHILYLTLH